MGRLGARNFVLHQTMTKSRITEHLETEIDGCLYHLHMLVKKNYVF